MVFSSIIFIFFFFPITYALVNFILFFAKKNNSVQVINISLLFLSLLFYAWGESKYVVVMIFSIVCNYSLGRLIASSETRLNKKIFLAAAVIINLGLLGMFKYSSMLFGIFADFAHIEKHTESLDIHLPIGISFFTFQALSYVVDIYRNPSLVQRNFINLALYISFFPQLIAGPIVRYHDIAKQLVSRSMSLANQYEGFKRFILGLSKKVLIANNMAIVADEIFGMASDELSFATAWIGIIAYSFQIYYDFSGYSDMAIGLGRIFGFRFPENFNYPYISKSVQDFWRRWHISLSSWFKDYLYIPLGGNKKGFSRTYLNLIVVFFLCGLWHGANWNFVIWGLFHGCFLVLERTPINIIFKTLPTLLRHCYLLLIVMIGWVFFRTDTFDQSLVYLKVMFGCKGALATPIVWKYLTDIEFLVYLTAAVCGSTPIFLKIFSSDKGVAKTVFSDIYVLILFPLSVMYLAANTYNPFIYFRF